MEGWFGLVAAAVVLVGTVPAVVDVYRGRFKPSRSTWFMWSALVLLTLLLQIDLDSGWAVWATAADGLSCLVLFGLSWRYGVGGFTRTDVICYAVWGGAVGLWLLADQPLAGLHLAVIADTAAAAPTLIKSWRHPDQESIWPYASSVLAGVLSVAALGHYGYDVLLYPVYICAINAVTVGFVWRARRRIVGIRDRERCKLYCKEVSF